MSYIMINGKDNPRELIFNGTKPQCLVYNGEIVWDANTIQEQYSDGNGNYSIKKNTEKTVTMAENTTYTINRGEGV